MLGHIFLHCGMPLPKHLLIGRNERPISRQEEIMWDSWDRADSGKKKVRLTTRLKEERKDVTLKKANTM